MSSLTNDYYDTSLQKNVIFVYFEPWTFNILFYVGYYALTYLISRLQWWSCDHKVFISLGLSTEGKYNKYLIAFKSTYKYNVSAYKP